MISAAPPGLVGLSEAIGPPYIPPEGLPENLSSYIRALVSGNEAGQFVEIDRYGRRHVTTFGDLSRRAHGIAGALRDTGRPDEAVALLCFESVRAFVAAAWACLLAGRDLLPFDTGRAFTNPGEFRDRVIEQAAAFPDVIVLTDHSMWRAMMSGGTVPLPILNTEDVPDGGAAVVDPGRQSSVLVRTSGTGGKAKLALLGGECLRHRFFDGFDNAGRACLYNLAHASVAGLRLLLPIGDRVVYLHPLRLTAQPSDWFAAVETFAVTDAGMSSSIASMILSTAEDVNHAARVDSLKRISFGAEVIVPGVVRRLLSAFRSRGIDDLGVSFVYSMTETGPLYRSILRLEEAIAELADETRPIALRHCVAGWRLQCVDDRGALVEEGERGRIRVTSDSKLFSGYHGDPPLPPDGRDGDVWFDTGDLAVLTRGRLTLSGREKSTVIVNARKITCEEIELGLSGIDGLTHSAVVVAPWRERDQVTDSIAVFFVPPRQDQATISAISRAIVSTLSSTFGVSARHVVAVAPDDIVRTATMKVIRDRLVEKYRSGELEVDASSRSPASPPRTDGNDALLELWQSALDLPHLPGWNDTFFDLGGDSLAAARLVSAVQEAYAFDLPVDRFFADPTPARLRALVTGGSPGAGAEPPAAPGVGRTDLVGGVEAYLKGWRGGHRPKSGELLVGYNVDGVNRPIFWVFQSYLEASWLAEALGAEQPLYAMRSAVNLLPTAAYSERTLRPLLDRYAWEILVASKGREFVLGGNCQGGIIALLLARRLRKIDRRPKRLFLVDWWFDHGRYSLPVDIFLGRGVDDEDPAHKSRLARFPKVRTLRVPGYYAHYFDPEHVSQIATHVRQKPKPAKRTTRDPAFRSRRLRRASGRDVGDG